MVDIAVIPSGGGGCAATAVAAAATAAPSGDAPSVGDGVDATVPTGDVPSGIFSSGCIAVSSCNFSSGCITGSSGNFASVFGVEYFH